MKDKVFVVTGATSGIGLAIAKEISEKRRKVIFIGRDQKKIDKLNSKFVNKNSYIAMKCNINDESEVKKTFEEIKKKYGNIFGLVNNAGINPSRNKIDKTSLKDWNQTLETNLTGAFLCSKYAINQMKKIKKGSIVNISSVAAFGMKERVSYSSSKAGLIGLTKSMALDHAKEDIRINCICPGYIKTKLVKDYLENLSKKEHETLIKRHPMHKFGDVEDIAKVVEFLLSNNSKWITGTVINVDGGYSAF